MHHIEPTLCTVCIASPTARGRRGVLLEEGQIRQRLGYVPSLAAQSPLRSPGEMPSLVTAIKIGSNELEAIPQTVFVLSIPTIFTNCFLHKYLPTPTPFNSEKDGKGQALPPAGQPAAMDPHS